MNSSSSTPANQALAPVAAQDRVFVWRDHASLWFSLGVGLLVMQMGAYLLPALSTMQALMAIGLGSVVGAGLLGWVGKLGCDSGLSSAGLMHSVYGRNFARLPIFLNIIQLLGWGSFELVVMRDATVALGKQSGAMTAAYWPWLATLIWGSVILLLMSGNMTTLVRRIISRVALPLVADYARHGKSGKSALTGAWTGFALANIWCYSLGVLVALTLPSEDLVTALLLAQGGLIALSLILLDEVDNAYGDAYSGAMSAHSILPAWSIRRWGLLIAALCTGLAMVLPMHSLEPFLLLLSSCFVPLFGVMLGRLAFGTNAVELMRDAPAVRWDAVAIWVLGIAFYHLLPYVTTAMGSALPTLVLTFTTAVATRQLQHSAQPMQA